MQLELRWLFMTIGWNPQYHIMQINFNKKSYRHAIFAPPKRPQRQVKVAAAVSRVLHLNAFV